MEKINVFYCIKLIRSNGERGWLIDGPEGIRIALEVHSDITQFETEKQATEFIKEKRLERNGIKAYVRTNQELIAEEQKLGTEYISAIEEPVYYCENHKGEKLFYDSKEEVYFFKEMGEFGHPIWNSEEAMRTFISEMKFQQLAIIMVKMTGKNQKEKKLIQVYGMQKNADGIMGEGKHIDIPDGEEHKFIN